MWNIRHFSWYFALIAISSSWQLGKKLAILKHDSAFSDHLIQLKGRRCIDHILVKHRAAMWEVATLTLATPSPRVLKLLRRKFCLCNYICIYHNFWTFTCTADYPQRSIFVVRGKKVQQITRTGLLPAPQNQRKSCYCIIGITTHKLGANVFVYKAEDRLHFLLRIGC